MPFNARPDVLHEANFRQMLDKKPNVAVMPWAATEAHNYHLPYGTDVIEGTAVGEQAVVKANEQGANAVLLPTVPFGIDHTQLYQIATISMRAATQQALLYDVADSLVRQGINRMILLNFHGANEFRSMIRDVMLDLPIFIVQVHGYLLADYKPLLEDPNGDHADEFETSLMMHLTPDWVAPLDTAGDGAKTPSTIPALDAPGVWYTRDWQALTESSGTGNPKASTPEKGEKMLAMLVDALVPVIVQLSNAKEGEFPLIIRGK